MWERGKMYVSVPSCITSLLDAHPSAVYVYHPTASCVRYDPVSVHAFIRISCYERRNNLLIVFVYWGQQRGLLTSMKQWSKCAVNAVHSAPVDWSPAPSCQQLMKESLSECIVGLLKFSDCSLNDTLNYLNTFVYVSSNTPPSHRCVSDPNMDRSL